MGLSDVIRFLACPYCGGGLCLSSLASGATAVVCGAGHSFDVARQGYASLLGAGAPGLDGDSPAMVRARADFLAAGHFSWVAELLGSMAADWAGSSAVEGCVVDVGAGTGYYLAAVLERLPSRVGVALDLSKAALRKAARAHPRIGAVGCDVWRQLPVATGAAILALNVFAPRNGAEMQRILGRGRCLLVVTPTDDHLAELVAGFGLLRVDGRKEERLNEKLGPYFDLVERRSCRYEAPLSRDQVAAAVAMGPSAWHSSGAAVPELPDLFSVTVSVTVSVLRVRPEV